MKNDWNIEIVTLPGHHRDGLTSDQFYENPKKDLLYLIYGINEVRMGWYLGGLAIYRNKQNPELIINPVRLRCFGYSETISFSNDGNLTFIYVCVSKDKQIQIPICIIDVVNKSYSYIKITNGNHYKLRDIGNEQFILKDTQFDNRFKSHDGRIIDVTKLKKYSINTLNTFTDIYFNNLECEFNEDGNIS